MIEPEIEEYEDMIVLERWLFVFGFYFFRVAGFVATIIFSSNHKWVRLYLESFYIQTNLGLPFHFCKSQYVQAHNVDVSFICMHATMILYC